MEGLEMRNINSKSWLKIKETELRNTQLLRKEMKHKIPEKLEIYDRIKKQNDLKFLILLGVG